MAGKLREETDRRERQRFGINAPVTAFIGGLEFPGFSRDLSNLGAYVYLDLAGKPSIAGDFEFLIELLSEI